MEEWFIVLYMGWLMVKISLLAVSYLYVTLPTQKWAAAHN